MYIINYYSSYFYVTFPDKDFTDAVAFLRSINIYYDAKVGKTVIQRDKIFDALSLFEYHSEEYLLMDSALTEFKRIVASYKPHQQYFRRVEFNSSILQPDFIPKEFQKKCFEHTLSRSRSYIADDAGLGKTSEAICTFGHWHAEGKVDKILIVVRPGISYNWQAEILNTITNFTEEDILIVDNKNKKLLFDNCENKKIIIVSNHLLKPVFLSYKKGQDLNKSAKRVRWKEFVNISEKLNTNKLCLVVDEAHELNNKDSISTRALLSHIHFFDYRLCLSATPHGNRWERYFNCMQLLDSKALAFSELSFKLFISNKMGDKFDPYAILEYNQDKIKTIKEKILDLYFIKRVKDDLPEMQYKKVIKPIYFKLSDKHVNLYQKFMQDEVNKLELDKGEITIKSILNKFPYLILILENPFLLKDRVTNDEIDKLITKWKFKDDERFNLLDTLISKYVKEEGHKIVVCDNHPLTLDMLADHYQKYNPLVMHGERHLDEKGKQHIQDLYNDRHNDHRILFMNPQTGGTGINLNKGGNRMIMYTVPNDAVLLEQTINRCHRINNTEDAIIEFLLADKSLDIFRYKKNMGRMKLNEQFITKNLERQELKSLLQMSIGDKKYG